MDIYLHEWEEIIQVEYQARQWPNKIPQLSVASTTEPIGELGVFRTLMPIMIHIYIFMCVC